MEVVAHAVRGAAESREARRRLALEKEAIQQTRTAQELQSTGSSGYGETGGVGLGGVLEDF